MDAIVGNRVRTNVVFLWKWNSGAYNSNNSWFYSIYNHLWTLNTLERTYDPMVIPWVILRRFATSEPYKFHVILHRLFAVSYHLLRIRLAFIRCTQTKQLLTFFTHTLLIFLYHLTILFITLSMNALSWLYSFLCYWKT